MFNHLNRITTVILAISLITVLLHIAEVIKLNGEIINIMQFTLTFLMGATASVYFIGLKAVKSHQEWPFVTGRISDIIVRGSGSECVVELEYSYRVNDMRHFNNSFSRGQKKIDGVTAKNYFKGSGNLKNEGFMTTEEIQDQAGQMVRVYYNPQNPWDSFLISPKPLEETAMLFPSALLIGFGVITFFVLLTGA